MAKYTAVHENKHRHSTVGNHDQHTRRDEKDGSLLSILEAAPDLVGQLFDDQNGDVGLASPGSKASDRVLSQGLGDDFVLVASRRWLRVHPLSDAELGVLLSTYVGI